MVVILAWLNNGQSIRKWWAFSIGEPHIQDILSVRCRLNKSEFKSLISSLNLQCIISDVRFVE